MAQNEVPAHDINPRAPHHVYIGLILAWFGFMFIWPYYPVTGVWAVLIGLAIALDDVLNHAFGWPTPLDWVWKKWIWRRLP